MSDLDYDALRKVAEAATPGPWGRASTDGMGVAIHRGEHDTIALYADRPNAEHIAAFDPPTVLRLLALAQRAEADRAAVERVRALADDWDERVEFYRGTGNYLAMASARDELRAALDREEDQ